MTTNAIDINAALAAQRDQHTRVTRLAAEASERINELDKTAPPAVREKRIREIRGKTEQASQRIRAEMAQRAQAARQQLSRQRFTSGYGKRTCYRVAERDRCSGGPGQPNLDRSGYREQQPD